MAKARDISDLGADDSYGVAAAKVVSVRAQELVEHSTDVLDTEDIERVHDMRVASRRLRAALEIFEPCFPRKRWKAALSEVKKIADALGTRRDADVSIDALERFAAELPAPDRPGVGSLIARLRAEQQEANAALAPQVSQDRLDDLAERLALLSSEARAAG